MQILIENNLIMALLVLALLAFAGTCIYVGKAPPRGDGGEEL